MESKYGREMKPGLREGGTLMTQFIGGDVTVDGLSADARLTSQFKWLSQGACACACAC